MAIVLSTINVRVEYNVYLSGSGNDGRSGLLGWLRTGIMARREMTCDSVRGGRARWGTMKDGQLALKP